MINSQETRNEIKENMRYLHGSVHQYSLLPKEAITMESTELGNKLGYIPGKLRVEKGPAQVHNRAQRVVFNPTPIEIEGENFYLEIKGYGLNGRELRPFHHVEGDLDYGMYYEVAKKEFEILGVAAQAKEIRHQLPVALLQFPRNRFVYDCIRGSCTLNWLWKDEEGFSEEKGTVRKLFRQYKEKGLEGIASQLASQAPVEEISRKFHEFDAITKPAGYLVRATRSPFRIVFKDRKGVNITPFEEAAYEAGRLYEFLIRRGILHQVPSQGNITTEGELMDFEDADYVNNTREIERNWRFMAEQFEGRAGNFKEYIALTLGKEFLGRFMNPFLQGTRLGNTPCQAADSVISMHEGAFGPLLSKKI